ncbi:MAG: OmpA family protein [Bacteroidota bacterium]
MRVVTLLILLFLPLFAQAQFRQADRHFENRAYDEALAAYESLMTDEDALIQTAAAYKYAQTKIRLNRGIEHLEESLDAVIAVIPLIENLSSQDQRALREEYRVSIRGVESLQRQLVNQVKREIRGQDLTALRMLQVELDQLAWSDEARERLQAVIEEEKKEAISNLFLEIGEYLEDGNYSEASTAIEPWLMDEDLLLQTAMNFTWVQTNILAYPDSTHWEENIVYALQLQENIDILSLENKRRLSDEYDLSQTSLNTLFNYLKRQVESELSRTNVETYWPFKDRVNELPWPARMEEQIAEMLDDRRAAIMESALRSLANSSLEELDNWEARYRDRDWGPEYQRNEFEAIRTRLVRRVMQNASASYRQLSYVYNNYYATEISRNPEAASALPIRLQNQFLQEHGFMKLQKFIDENPRHGWAMDCYVESLLEILNADERHKLTDFLRDYPFSILDDLVWGHLVLNSRELKSLPGADQSAIDQLVRDHTIIYSFHDSEDATEENLIKYLDALERHAKRPIIYPSFIRTAQVCLRAEEWDLLDQLIAKGREVLVYNQPLDCDVYFTAYYDRQFWLADVQEILSRPRFSSMVEPIPMASTTEYNEYGPVISANGKSLYFARKRDHVSSYDIVVSHLEPDGNWGIPQQIESFTTELNEVPLSLNGGENEMLIFLEGRLALSRKRNGVWSSPVKLKGTIADVRWHGPATLSNDGYYLIVELSASAWQQATVSSTDLYIAERQSSGEYDLLGPLTGVNTIGQDSGPLLSYDNRTLYFSSTFLEGLGGKDIFVIKREGPGWDTWSKPENFGTAVNSFYNDENLKLTTAVDGLQAYLNVYANETDSEDLYHTVLPNTVAPDPMRIVQIPVRSPDSIEIDSFLTRISDPEGNIFAQGNLVDDGYTVLVPEDMDQMTVFIDHKNEEDSGVLPVEFVIDLGPEVPIVPLVDINTVDSLLSGRERMRLLQSYASNQSDFSPDVNARRQLRQLLELLSSEPEKIITLYAYADNTGSEDYNLELCQARGEAVRNFLVEQGLEAERIQLVAHGKTDFIAPNNTELGRARNRRVEVGIE